MIIDALKDKYSLPVLLIKLCMARSSYFYQEKVLRRKDKYLDIRRKIKDLFEENRECFGYR